MLLSLFVSCRPRQWVKNYLVFASVFFSFNFQFLPWARSFLVFIAFCLVSSSIYLLNDVLDREADRAHPSKCRRPIASGAVRPNVALFASVLLLTSSLAIALLVHVGLVLVIASYAVVQVAYCLRLKREPLLDLFCIAIGFLMRATAGLIATELGSSPWFLLTIGLLALFLAIEKRKAELRIALETGIETRKVLQRYSLPLLQRLESMVASSTFMAYTLWSSGPALGGASTSWMLLTVPFVLVGIFRYQLLSDPDESFRRSEQFPERNSERPEEILLGDRGIQLTLLGWLVVSTFVNVLG